MTGEVRPLWVAANLRVPTDAGAISGVDPSGRGVPFRPIRDVAELREPLESRVMAGFGGIISEIGASMMVGGNIKDQTRTLTTAMVLETGKGNFDVAIALAVLLLALIFLVNWMLTSLQQRAP
jgi:ABC-type tungstate transport system substrate-binding protein